MPYKLLFIRIIILILLSRFTISYAQINEGNPEITGLYDNAKNFNNTGKYSLAIDALKQIITLKEKTNTDAPPEYVKIYNRLANAYVAQGNLQQAIEYYTKALQNTSDSYNRSIIIDNIATVYSLQGDYLKAIDFYENSLAVLQESKKKDKYSKIVENYHNQGYAYNKLHNYQAAKDKFLKSILITKQNNLNDIADNYYNCGVAYKRLDSLELAEYYFIKAVDINLKIYGKEHIKTTLSYLYLANFYAKIGEFTKAAPIFSKVYNKLLATVGEKHPYTSDYHKFVSDMYFLMGNYKQALESCQQSIVSKITEINDRSIYKNPSLDAVPDIELLEILKRKAQVLLKLADKENKESNLKAALSTLELTVGFIEQLRMGYLYEDSKLVLAEKEYESYMSIIRIAYELLNITGNRNYIHVAFKYSERSKYAILRESINEESARNSASIPDSIQNHIQEIKEQIGIIRLQIENENKLEKPDGLKQNELKENLFQLTQSQEKTIKELEQNYPKYYKRKYENIVVSITELQSVLVQKEAVISYELTDNTLYTFVITKDKYDLLRNPIDSTFYKNLKSYSDFLHSEYLTSYVSFRIPSYELYQKLIEPILHYIEGKNLLIIPNSELSLISFESLTTEPYVESEYAYYNREPYLLRKYPIGYSYSATLYTNSKHRKKKWNPNFLGFAPDYKNSRDTLQFLPTVSKNIKKISWLMRSKIFTKEDATEQNFKKHAGSYGILHLYAHGNEDLENPQFSKMYFSYKNDSVEDGYLYAYEVEELNFNAELVVLASCLSGSGAVKKGEGVISIGRSFMNSETPALVTSLWLAYYHATLFELKVFYRNLLLGKRKDEALRIAKLKYLDSAEILQSHPKYWNSLVIIGNQDPIFKGYLIKVALLPVILFFSLILLFIKIRKRKTKRAIKM
ncbi:MAG: CHAT domain-containing protein [Bacteroidales bacterium]|nr:CHAT domain-containing protein [Bacteroidales bacterium]